jgi:hypothetical protein
MRIMRRPFPRRYGTWHPYVHGSLASGRGPGGGVSLVPMYGPAGEVGPVGSTDHPYQGMDPSDPVTWVRPYNPQPGMISYLNFDGARPNEGQVISGPRKGRRR